MLQHSSAHQVIDDSYEEAAAGAVRDVLAGAQLLLRSAVCKSGSLAERPLAERLRRSAARLNRPCAAAAQTQAHQSYLEQVAAGALVCVRLQVLAPLHVLNLYLVVRHLGAS